MELSQGSVFGPMLFNLYTTPLSYLLTDSSLQFHFYSDDTQIYVSSSTEANVALTKLTSTLDQVDSWFCSNRLVINASKTEYQSINEDLTSGSSPEGDVRDVPGGICNYR